MSAVSDSSLRMRNAPGISQRWRRQAKVAATTAVGLTPLSLGLVTWQLLGSDTSPYVPRPSTWWAAVRGLHQAGTLMPAISATASTFALAVMLATVFGVVLGTLIGASKRVARATGPLLEFWRTLPPPAIVPVALLLLGLGRTMQVVVVVVAAFWPIVLNTAVAVRSLHPVMLDATSTLQLAWPARVRKVLLPSVLPAVLLGLRVATPVCVLITLLVEMLTGAPGLGSLLLQAQRSFLAAEAFGLLMVGGLFGLLVNIGLGATERLLLRAWPPTKGSA